jgi:hypothetical protein
MWDMMQNDDGFEECCVLGVVAMRRDGCSCSSSSISRICAEERADLELVKRRTWWWQ